MTILKFTAAKRNNGAITIHRHVVPCRWPNGDLIRAGDLKVGAEYIYTLDDSGDFFVVKEGKAHES